MYAPARDVAECTWGEKALLHIDALPAFPKIVVGLREKVDDFRTFSVIVQIYNLFSVFLLWGTPSLQMLDEPRISIRVVCRVERRAYS